MSISKEVQYEVQIKKLKQELEIEKKKNGFTNAILEGGTLIIWAVNERFELASFNQNYFSEFISEDNKAKITYQQGPKLKTIRARTFWRRKYREALNGESLNFEIRLDYVPGEIWKEVFLNPTYDISGRIIAVSGLAYDITEKMQSRIEIMKSEAKFRTIFESFQDLYFRCDFNGKIIMLSPSVKEITGFTEKYMLGKNVQNYYVYTSKIKSLLKELIQKKSIRNLEFDLLHRSGKKIPCICNLRIVYDGENAQYIEGVARDITELKMVNLQLQHSKELAERSLKVKERFLANMSHEIRTPLNGIMGMLHLLDKSELNPGQQEHIGALKRSADILMDLLDDLLDISKIEAGKMIPKHRSFKTAGLMKKLSQLYSRQAQKNGLAIEFEVAEDVPKVILSDEIKLIQIFSNLISNAIKFTPAGGKVKARLEVEKIKEANHYTLKGLVSDTGIGISEKNRARLFKSFTQLDSSNSKSYKGTGLGLYLSKRLTRLFKGNMGVESLPGEGSTFWFTFNTKTSANESIKSNNKKSKTISLATNPSILIVDDNAINLQLAAELLKKAGGVITTAESGFEAIKKCDEEKFDIIVMDIQMPDMDGLTTSKRIKENGRNKSTPVIAMTAYTDQNEFIEAGMDDYLSKPIDPAKLLKKVQHWAQNPQQEPIKQEPPAEKSGLEDINYATLDALAKYGGQEMVDEALEEFTSECQQQLDASEKLLKKEKYDDLQVIFHTLKGNAGTLGLEKIAALSEIMENSIKMKNYHIFEVDLNHLLRLFEDFKKELKSSKTKIQANG